MHGGRGHCERAQPTDFFLPRLAVQSTLHTTDTALDGYNHGSCITTVHSLPGISTTLLRLADWSVALRVFSQRILCISHDVLNFEFLRAQATPHDAYSPFSEVRAGPLWLHASQCLNSIAESCGGSYWAECNRVSGSQPLIR